MAQQIKQASVDEALLNKLSRYFGISPEEATPQQMRARIAANVVNEQSLLVRAMPLFLKNIALKIAFKAVGERKICLSLSNLGNVKLPEAMRPYVQRMDFILAPQSSAPHNCGALSYDGTLYINFIRNIQEPELEAHFCRILQEHGLRVTVESNKRIHMVNRYGECCFVVICVMLYHRMKFQLCCQILTHWHTN